MTICASVKVRDGLVLATDSMTQIQAKDPAGNIGVVKTYSNARKLFQVGTHPVGVMSYGLGNIGPRSIQGLVDDFAKQAGESGVLGIAKELFAFVKSIYDNEFGLTEPSAHPALGFFIAGYSPTAVFAEEWEFLLPRDSAPVAARPEATFGASWRGVSIPFSRLYKGFDPRVRQQIIDAGVSKEAADKILGSFEAPVVYDGMPVQDAINFAAFILTVTIGMANFEAGAPSCGGPIQLATILPRDGFKWIAEPQLSVRSPLNTRGGE